MLKKILEYFSPDDIYGGLWRLIILNVVSMTLLRAVIHPELVIFQVHKWTSIDYWSMIIMSGLLISIDAMLIVLLSWKYLNNWKDSLGVATLVGTTHVFFPLFTFGLTAGAVFVTEKLGLPIALAGGLQTAIYFTALVFIMSHLGEVHTSVREEEINVLRPNRSVMTWQWIKEIFPIVFAVSVDALMVWPAKIAFMARYTPTQFAFSFIFIGITVFTLVSSSGFLVLWLKSWLWHDNSVTNYVHKFDWIGSIVLVFVFIYFSVFASVYVLYTFFEASLLLETTTIWGTTIILCIVYYFWIWNVGEIHTASKIRTWVVK